MRRMIIWVAAILGLLVLLSFVGGYYLTELALRPRFERNAERCYENFVENYPTLQSWGDSLRQAQNLTLEHLTAEDGTPLTAYRIMADKPTHRTAVVVHGYTDHPFGMLQIAWIYHRMGYNILLPTLRYHGESGGDSIGMGWNDRLDVKAWIDQLPTLFGAEQQVVVHGISMGAATTMMLAGEADLTPAVRCFVEDCGYMGVWEQFQKELKEDYHLPPFPILHTANLICRWRFGWDFLEASSLEAVRRCERPMLFIHGSEDRYVPTWMVYPLYYEKGGAKEDKEKWIAPESRHAVSFADHPEEYIQRVKAFVGRYISE